MLFCGSNHSDPRSTSSRDDWTILVGNIGTQKSTCDRFLDFADWVNPEEQFQNVGKQEHAGHGFDTVNG